RYRGDEKSTFQQALIVSGSTVNEQDMTVNVEVDSDTLDILNYERFQNREDFYYKVLDSEYFSFPSTVNIKAGESTTRMDSEFICKYMDLVEKWVRPMTIEDDPSSNYTAKTRKQYRKPLLRANRFKDNSRPYTGTTLKAVMECNED